MTAWDQVSTLPLWLLAPMVIGLGWVAWRGYGEPGALRDAPSRTIGLGVADLLVGLGLMLTGMSLGALLLGLIDEAALVQYMLATIAVQLVGLGLPAGYLAVRAVWSGAGLRHVGFLPRRGVREVGIGLGGGLLVLMIVPGVILLVAIVGLLVFGQPAPTVAHELLVKLRDSDSALGTALLCISAIAVAPVLEEAVYRGLWQSMLVEALGERRRGPAVMLAAVLFMLMHSGVDWQAMPALWVMGVMLGWVYERTGSLLPPIVMHAVFNTWNVLLVLFFLEPTGG